jgi:hypothetical protein
VRSPISPGQTAPERFSDSSDNIAANGPTSWVECSKATAAKVGAASANRFPSNAALALA